MTIAFAGEVRYRLPIDAALDWMASSLVQNGLDTAKVAALMRTTLDAVQRRIA